MIDKMGKFRWIISAVLIGGIFFSGMVAGDLLAPVNGDGKLASSFIQQAVAEESPTESIPDAVEKVIPAVVYIQSKRMVKQRQANSPFFDNPLFRDFFDDFLRRYNVPREREQQFLGSGVIVSEKGYILTNNHLVENAKEVEVLLPDQRRFDAKVIGTDPRSDVAVLKIEGDNLSVVRLGDSEKIRLGQTVLAIGYPYAVGQTVTRGIVSALGRALRLVDYEDFIQTDAAINPGNSGGALINIQGELIGINTAIYSRSGGNQGIGFAIPINLARNIMDNIIEHGRVIRGFVGVVPQDLDPEMAEFFDLKDAGGVLVSQVAEDSPAEKAGFKQGDIILDFDGKEMKSTNEFRRLAAEKKPGSKVEVTVLRDGKRKNLQVAVGKRPDEIINQAEDQMEDRSPLFLGVGIITLNDEYRDALDIPANIRGVIITDIDQGTPAEKAGLNRGDVVVEVNRVRISNLKDFREVLDRSRDDKVLLLIYRAGGYIFITVRAK
ncbi:MAG: DegQ family serine endoprotease [Candidatus Krumholzibacteriota bacterium]|nr:DegQ family serine endoprotease [Candidatus Krumholzibacteriota bacterium]